MCCTLIKKKSSNVTKGFIREMHVDIVLWFKLLFHWLPASHFGHIDRNMAVNVLIFCGVPDNMLDDLPQYQSRQKILLLLIRSSEVMGIFRHLLLNMSINRHDDFVKKILLGFDTSIVWFSCELGPGVLYIICFI